MEILTGDEISLNGKKQMVSNWEMIFLSQCLDGQIKRKGPKSPARITLAIPDEWCAEIMNSVLGYKRVETNYALIRLEK